MVFKLSNIWIGMESCKAFILSNQFYLEVLYDDSRIVEHNDGIIYKGSV